MTLSADQRQTLLALARQSVIGRVRDVRGSAPGAQAPAPANMPEASGVFVTLKIEGELRGCLGTLNCCASLDQEVVRCAAEAASEDPRFPPVCSEELEHVRIEISVLGALQEIDPAAADAFAIGRHGLVVEHGPRRGLLLPQVAVEWSWSPEQFLGHTCTKAGLSVDAWRNGALVYRFDAEVFGD